MQPQQGPFDDTQQDLMQQQFLTQQQRQDTSSIAPPPPLIPLCTPGSATGQTSQSATVASGATRSSTSKHKQSAYGDDRSARSSEKRQKAYGTPTAITITSLTQTLKTFNKSFNCSMSAGPGGSSRKYEAEEAVLKIQNEAVVVVQLQKTHLTNDQLVVFLDLFQTSISHATTYLGIKKEDF
jgi:hypothetical protein